MNNNTNKVRWLLGIGATLIYMAGLSFFSSVIGTDALKVLVNTLISVSLIAVSIGIEDSYKLKGLGKYSFILGFLSFLSTFIFIGTRGMFGEYLSFDGNGAGLYVTFISLLVSLFAYICSLRYKDSFLVHIKYAGLLVALYTFMSHFSGNTLANLSVIGIILLFLNYVKISSNINRFSKIASLVYILVTVLSINEFSIDGNLDIIFSLVIVLTNAINICILLHKDKRPLINVLALSLFVMNTSLLTSSIFINRHFGLALLISAIVYSLLEIFINYSKVIKDNRISIFQKVILNISYLELFSSAEGLLEYCILTAIIFGTSFINSFVYKNDKYEYKIIPLKLIFIVNSILKVISMKLFPLNDAIGYIVLDLTFLGVMCFTKNDIHKMECTVLTIYYSAMLLLYENLTPSLYVLSGVIAMLNYYVVIYRNDDTTSSRGRLYYGLLLLMLLVSLNNVTMNNSKYLILSLVFGLLSFLNYNDKVGFAITLPALYITLSHYISGLETLSLPIRSLLSIVNMYACFTLWFDSLNIEENTKIILQGISLIGISLISISSSYVLDTLLTIVVAVIMIYYGIKNRKYNIIHNCGIAIVIIALLSLTSFLGEARAFIYLLIVGGGIIYFVIRLAAKGIPEEASIEVKDKKEDVISKQRKVVENKSQQKVAFCYNCGNSLNGSETFCGKCGTKLK